MSAWTQPVTLMTVTPEEPVDWSATRDQPLGEPAAPITGPIMPYVPPPVPYDFTRPQYVPQQQPTQISYVQPVARKGITGPQAAVLIAVLLVVLPVLCCLGLAMVGAIGGGGSVSPTP